MPRRPRKTTPQDIETGTICQWFDANGIPCKNKAWHRSYTGPRIYWCPEHDCHACVARGRHGRMVNGATNKLCKKCGGVADIKFDKVDKPCRYRDTKDKECGKTPTHQIGNTYFCVKHACAACGIFKAENKRNLCDRCAHGGKGRFFCKRETTTKKVREDKVEESTEAYEALPSAAGKTLACATAGCGRPAMVDDTLCLDHRIAKKPAFVYTLVELRKRTEAAHAREVNEWVDSINARFTAASDRFFAEGVIEWTWKELRPDAKQPRDYIARRVQGAIAMDGPVCELLGQGAVSNCTIANVVCQRACASNGPIRRNAATLAAATRCR